MTRKNSVLNKDGFFGTLIFIYVILSVYFNQSVPKIAHYFSIAVFGMAFVDSVLIKRKRIYINRAVTFYLIFTLWAIISFFWVVSEEFYLGYFERIVFCAIVVFFFYNLLKWYDIYNYFLWGIVVGGIINLLVFFNLFPYYYNVLDEETWRFVGTMGNPNSLAIFISFSIFASILLINSFMTKEQKYLRWMLFFNIPASIYLIIQTGSRKGLILGFSFLFLFFLPFIKSVKGTIAALFIVLLFFAGFNYLIEQEDFSGQIEFVLKRFEGARETIEGTGVEGSSEQRLDFIETGVNIWKNNPFLGVGFNNFRYFSGGFYAHNNFIELLSTLGLIGFFLFYFFIIFAASNILKIIDWNPRISAIFFMIVFVLMDYVWVSYYDIPYLMMWVMLSSFKLKEDFKNTEESK